MRFYHDQFRKRPMVTLALTNGILNAVGDILAQRIAFLREKDPAVGADLQWARVARFATFGAAMGPCIGGWLHLLSRAVPLGSSAVGSQICKRVVLDQVIMAPFILSSFLVSMATMEGLSGPATREKLSTLFKPALLVNWTVWPFIQLANFTLIPLPFRVPFQSVCGIGWTVYLSSLNNGSSQEQVIEKRLIHQIGLRDA